jgi:hypothetical protein
MNKMRTLKKIVPAAFVSAATIAILLSSCVQQDPTVSAPTPTPSATVTEQVTPSPTLTVAPEEGGTIGVEGGGSGPSPAAAPSDVAVPSVNVVDDIAEDDTYNRDAFGSPWKDVDGNGCDTRNDVLARDMTDEVFKDSKQCKVEYGVLSDPYTGTVINFQYGKGTSQLVQIDHIVPLRTAWYAGAKNWSDDLRAEIANDPENLLAVDGKTNSSKGAKGPAEWMPTNTGYTCEYSQKFIHIVEKYQLAIEVVDYRVIEQGLASC